MSIVRATQTFHHAGGTTVGGTELSGDDPIAVAFAPLFEVIQEDEEINPNTAGWDGTSIEERKAADEEEQVTEEVAYEEEDVPYTEWTYNELRSLAKERELDTTGKTADLIARLEAWDEEHPDADV